MSTDQKILHVMVDIETLGLKPGCKILQIGACTFNTGDTKFFCANIDRNRQEALTEEPDTVYWWENQSEAAKQAVLTPTESINIREALEAFSDWLNSLREDGSVKLNIWSNPASFDLRILEAACIIYFNPVPWNFRAEMCFRTLYNLFPNIPAEDFEGTKHTAIDDAIHQARHAEAIFDALAHGYQIP